MNKGKNLLKLATHLDPPISTSSPSIYSVLIPALGLVADERITLLIPVI